MPFFRKYATATHIYIPIPKRGVVDNAVSADWTPATGDVKFSIDGAAAANIGTLPTAVAMGNTAYWDFTIATGEVTGKKTVVTVSDSATKAVEDQTFLIETYGHASAEYQADLSAANLPANVTQLLGTAWLVPAVAGTPDVNTKQIGGAASQGAAGYAAVDFAQVLPTTPVANTLGEALYLADILGGRFGTAQGGGASTITLDAGASSVDSRYNGYLVYLYGGTGGGVRGVGQARTIIAYNGTTKVATVDSAWGTNPDNTSKFMLLVHPKADVALWLATAVSTPTVAGVPNVNAKTWNDLATVALPLIPATAGRSLVVDAAGLADSNAVKVGPTGSGTAQTARDIGASVLLSSGTGAGQLDFTSGVVKANLAQILGTAITETAGQIAAAFKKFFDKATPTGTINSLPDAVPDASGGLPVTGNRLTAIPVVAHVTLVDTVTTNTDMRGTDNAATAANLATAKTVIDAINAIVAHVTYGNSALKTLIDALPTSAQNAVAVEAAILNEGDATALLAAIAAKVETFLINDGDASATLAAIAAAVRTNLTTELGRIDAAVSSRLATASYTSPPSAATVASQVRTELTTELARVDVAISSRGTGTGTALDAAGVRSAVGLASANLDTQIGLLATAASLATLAGKFTGITLLADWLRRMCRGDAGTAGMVAAQSEINTGGTSTFDGTTDNLQDIKDAAGGGGGTIVASLALSRAQARDVLRGNDLTCVIGTSLRFSFTGDNALGNISSRTKLWFTAKQSKDKSDDDAILQVLEGTGLIRLNKAATTAAWAIIDVTDASTGEVDITIYAAATSALVAMQGLVWDVKELIAASPADAVTLTDGLLNVVPSVTRATS